MTEDGQKLDGELVHRILTGDETAFDALYKRHKPRLQQFIANKVDDWRDVEELTNDTFLQAREHLHTLQAPEKVLNWMFRIAGQLVVGWHRQHKTSGATQGYTNVHEAEGEAAATAVIHQTAEEYVMEVERWTAVSAAIAQLPELERKMLHLQLENKKYEEIANICEVSVSSVRNRLSRAKKQLKTWAAAWEKANTEDRDLDFSEFNERKGKS